MRLFTALKLLEREWAGKFVLGIGLGDAGRNLARALVGCGGCGLFLEWDPAHLRISSREGCCDFTVQTTTEALRVCKIELRRRRALAVALVSHSQDELQAHLQELVDRGVLPDFLAVDKAACMGAGSAATVFAGGARVLDGLGMDDLGSGPHNATNLSLLLQEFQETFAAHTRSEVAATFAERRSRDAALLADAQSGPSASRFGKIFSIWLASAPVLFPRSLERAVWTGEPSPQTSA